MTTTPEPQQPTEPVEMPPEPTPETHPDLFEPQGEPPTGSRPIGVPGPDEPSP